MSGDNNPVSFGSSSLIILSSGYLVSQNPPLHVACEEGHTEVVQLLLSKGAKLAALNYKGENCLDIAIAEDRRYLIENQSLLPILTKTAQLYIIIYYY